MRRGGEGGGVGWKRGLRRYLAGTIGRSQVWVLMMMMRLLSSVFFFFFFSSYGSEVPRVAQRSGMCTCMYSTGSVPNVCLLI